MNASAAIEAENRNSLQSWLMAFRPKTLVAAFVPVMTGTALAWALGIEVIWSLSLFALLASLCIQVGTNLVNDALDFTKGTDTHARLGPVRVSASGILKPAQVLRMAYFFFALAFIFGIPLVGAGGWPILVIGLGALVFAYAYTGGPYPLAYNGLGELFVILFFGFIAVSGTVYLHALEWRPEALLAGLQVGFFSTVLIAINNLRDSHEDRANHKRTLAVRFGLRFARFEIAFFALAPFAAGLLGWAYFDRWAAGVAPLVALPLAIKISRSVFKSEPGRLYNKYLGQAAALNLLFSVLLIVGLSWSSSHGR